MPTAEGPPGAPFFEAADAVTAMEVDELAGHIEPGEAAVHKSRQWIRMGRDLESHAWAPARIARKISKVIEDKVERRTGRRVSVRTSYYYRVMAAHGWQDKEWAARRRESSPFASSSSSPPPAPASRQKTSSGDISSAPRGGVKNSVKIAANAAADSEPVGEDEVDEEEEEEARAPLNHELCAALRDASDCLRWSARLLGDETWMGRVDLESKHPRDYREACRSVRACINVVEEEGSRRRKVPATAHHLFRELVGKTDLSLLRISVLFAERRLHVVREEGDQIKGALAKAYRAGKGLDAPPILRPASRNGALLAGWSGQQCLGCDGWRVEAVNAPAGQPQRRCVDCELELEALVAAKCPGCGAMVYKSGPRGQACPNCGYKWAPPREQLAAMAPAEEVNQNA